MMKTMSPNKRASNAPSAKAIKAERERRGLTQEQAADMLGISRRMWFYYEAAPRKKSPSVAAGLLLRLFVDGFDFSKISEK